MRNRLAILSLLVATFTCSPACRADESVVAQSGGTSSAYSPPDGGVRGVAQEPSYNNYGVPNNSLRQPIGDSPNPVDSNANTESKTVKKAKTGSAPGPAIGMPDRVAKTGLGMTDRTAKTGIGMTDRTAKTGFGLAHQGIKYSIGGPFKAVKETFKAVF